MCPAATQPPVVTEVCYPTVVLGNSEASAIARRALRERLDRDDPEWAFLRRHAHISQLRRHAEELHRRAEEFSRLADTLERELTRA